MSFYRRMRVYALVLALMLIIVMIAIGLVALYGGEEGLYELLSKIGVIVGILLVVSILAVAIADILRQILRIFA